MERKIRVLMQPSDIQGVGHFRSIWPAQSMQKYYGKEIDVEIGVDVDFKNINYLSNFDIIHFHRQMGDYEKFPEWNDRRNSFYDVMNSSALDKNFIENFYKDLFKSVGYKTKNYYSICRETHEGVDYLYYVGMELEKE